MASKSDPKNQKSSIGLGRGFDSLIPQDFDDTILVDEQERIQKLHIDDVQPNPDQPRRTFDEQSLGELAQSIEQHGVLQPIVVHLGDDDVYIIVAGERRWRAARQAGLTHVPAIVRTLEELEQLQIALVENVQRVDLSPLEQAASIQRLHDQFSIGMDEIAKRLGKAPTTVNNIVRLLNLPKEAAEALRDKLITEGHARSVLALKDMPDKQEQLLHFIIKNHWNVRQAEQFVVACKKGANSAKAAQKKTETTNAATEKLSQKLGVPVSIKRTAKGGKLELGFKTETELSSLMRKLGKK